MTAPPSPGSARTSGRWAAALLAASVAVIGCASTPNLPARPLGAAGVRAGRAEGVIAGAGGLHVYWRAWLPPTPARAVFVIVHGLKDHGGRYEELSAALVARGVAVYAPDLRGHARSEGERVWVQDFEQYLGDLDRVLALVRAREHDVPVFLFGHSMGGAIVTLYALERKPALAGLVLSAPALEVDASFVTVGATRMLGTMTPHAKVFQLELDDFSRDQAVVASGKKDPLVYQEAAPARTARELMAAIREIRAHMEDVTVPLLVLHGAADKVTPPHGSEELVARAASKDKTLKLYPNLFHDLAHEPERAVVIADVTTWVAHRLPPTGANPGVP